MMPNISSVALVGGSGMIVVALIFIALGLTSGCNWKYLGLGALAWLITVAIKVVIAILLNPWIVARMRMLPQPWANMAIGLYGGFLTSVTEVGLVWLLLRYTRLRQAAWRNVLGFGIAFGAIEALLLGIGSLAAVLVARTMPQQLPAEALEALARSDSVLFQIAPIWERVFACLGHIATNVMIFYAVARPAVVWFWGAFVYKGLIDGLATVSIIAGLTKTLDQIWILEAATAIWGIAGLFITLLIGRRYPKANQGASASSPPREA